MKRERDDSENESQTDISGDTRTITCFYSNCKQKGLVFSTHDEYENHVLGHHFHQCSECKRRFPSDGYLQVHIEENHDPFFRIRKEKGEKVYKCLEYTTGCNKVCIDRRKRRLHMIDKHGYPADFQFRVIDYGIN